MLVPETVSRKILKLVRVQGQTFAGGSAQHDAAHKNRLQDAEEGIPLRGQRNCRDEELREVFAF